MTGRYPYSAYMGKSIIFLALLLTTALVAQSSRSQPTPEECGVWNRELTFAQSVEHHDARAFAAHLNPGAVFNAGTSSPNRGKDKVLAGWAAIIEGKTVRVRWRPDIVNIGGDPNIAVSHGPFMVEDAGPDSGAKEKARYSVGHFTTIWTRQSAKAPWLVLFDGGEPATPVSDLAAAEKFMSQAAASCPAR